MSKLCALHIFSKVALTVVVLFDNRIIHHRRLPSVCVLYHIIVYTFDVLFSVLTSLLLFIYKTRCTLPAPPGLDGQLLSLDAGKVYAPRELSDARDRR